MLPIVSFYYIKLYYLIQFYPLAKSKAVFKSVFFADFHSQCW